jgi:hypothetical protein
VIDEAEFRARLARGAVERDMALAHRHIPGRPYREERMSAASIRRVLEQYQRLVGDVSGQSDALCARMVEVEQKFNTAAASHSNVIEEIASGIAEIENFTNQLSNGGPPLGPTSPPVAPSPAPGPSPLAAADHNGVTRNP